MLQHDGVSSRPCSAEGWPTALGDSSWTSAASHLFHLEETMRMVLLVSTAFLPCLLLRVVPAPALLTLLPAREKLSLADECNTMVNV